MFVLVCKQRESMCVWTASPNKTRIGNCLVWASRVNSAEEKIDVVAENPYGHPHI